MRMNPALFIRCIVVAFLSFYSTCSYAQCNFIFTQNTVGCVDLYLAARAQETDSATVIERIWTLTGPAGLVFTSTVGTNTPQFDYLIGDSGSYCLTLHSRSSNGQVCTIQKCGIYAAALPHLDFSFSPTLGCAPLQVQAVCNSLAGSGTIDSVVIDWGCGSAYIGTICNGAPIPHSYSCPPGCYKVTTVVRNTFGCYSDTSYLNKICIIPKPHVFFTANITTVNCTTTPLPVTFTADPTGLPCTTYHWYVNDSLIYSDSLSNIFQHTFPVNPYCYDIKLIVTHCTGCSDSSTRLGYICVRDFPVINFTSNADSGCYAPGDPFTLILTNTSGAPAQLTWSLNGPGAGGPLVVQSPQTGGSASWNLSTPGIYYVTTSGTFGAGCTTSLPSQQVIVISAKPNITFTTADTFSCKLPYLVHYTSAGCPSCALTWQANGGSPSSANTTNFNTTYSTNNNFVTSLTAVDPNGCSSTVTQQLVRTRPLIGKIGFNKAKGCSPVCATFDDLTNVTLLNTTIASACWSFLGPVNVPIIPGACKDTIKRCFVDTGCYTVQLAVTTVSGCTDTVILVDTICVGAKPNCTLNATPNSMCFEADSVHFVFGCTNSFDRIFCDFGDGVAGNFYTPDFFHIYQDTGTITTTCFAYKDSCSSDSFNFVVNIFPPITKFLDSTFCGMGDTVFLYNKSIGATNYLWTFCNGLTSTLQNPHVILPPCDTCSVKLQTHSSVTGCDHEKIQVISTACDSVALTPLDTVVCRNSTVKYYNISSSKTTSFTRWDWDTSAITGNGLNWTGAGTSGGDPVNHIYTTAGIFGIALRNKSTAGCIDTAYGTVTICDLIPEFGPYSVCLPLPICFINTTVDQYCAITSWLWDFGDGTTDTVQSPCHVFATQGTYTVTLVVTNSAGCTRTISHDVIASSPILISYDIDTLLCEGSNVCATNSSQNNLQFNWQISGGATPAQSPLYAPCFNFPAGAGDYELHLNISALGLCTVDDYRTIHVHNPIAAGYASQDTIICPNPPQLISFYDTSLYTDPDPIGTRIWDFGDSSYAYTNPANHIYNQPGRYVVTLTVTTADGCSDMDTVEVIVVLGPFGSLNAAPLGVCACKDSVTYTLSTYNANCVKLFTGCQASVFTACPIVPIGTEINPTNFTFYWRFCVTDTCQPQVLFQDASGCEVVLEKPFIAIDSPVVKFRFDNYGVCVDGIVCFFDSTSYTLPSTYSYTVQRLWDFGDPASGALNFDTAANPCHYYAGPGGYNAKLYIWSNLGCFDSIISNVVVVPEFPIAGSYADDSLVCANSPICFHDSSWIYPLTGADYWVWDFGDSHIDTTHSPDICHSYTTGGYYRVTMCVYDSIGCPDCDSSIVIRVIDNPIANAGGDQAICRGYTTMLNGSGGVACHWEPTSLVSNPDICNPLITLFNDAHIVLIVTDQYLCADTDTVQLTISYVTASFNVGTTFCTDDTVCVTDNSSSFNGLLTNWLFDYGDGDTLMGTYACHYYTNPGNYNIVETAINEHGCFDTAMHSILVWPSPQALFSLKDTVICANQQICPLNLSTSVSPIVNTDWNYGFNQGGFNGANSPCHTFTPPFFPTFDVSLAITDQNGCHDTAVIVVTVNELPNANFAWSTSCEDQDMPLSSTSVQGDAPIAVCEWTLWLGATPPTLDSNCNTSFHFPPGTHDVQLVLTDLNGCSDTIIQTVLTDSLSQLVIYPGDTTICLGTSVDYTVSGVFDHITWTPNIWISDATSANVTISPLADIGYIVSAVNGVCNSASDTFTIQTIQQIPIQVEATPDHIVLGLSSNLASQYPGHVDSIVWTPDETLDCHACPNPIATPFQTTTYTATIYYSRNGVTCTSSASATIDVLGTCDGRSIYVPNTFTPNGDGLNDVFMIRGLPIAKINYFRIFDRWGKLIFEATNGEGNNPRWAWDGNDLQGGKLNPAVFVYTYEIECVNHDIFSGHGNVTLVR